jgi:two-component system, chemotaxis family, response regulator Rcp1
MSGAACPGRPIQILRVENNLHDVRLTIEALRQSKVRNSLYVARPRDQALAFLHRDGTSPTQPRPDVILLDLPHKDGRELASEIKSDPGLGSIPVVMLTTSSAEQDELRSYNLPADCYITRPMDLEQFLEVVRCIEEFWVSIVVLPARRSGQQASAG